MDLIEYNQVNKRSVNRHPWELARLQILTFLLKKAGQTDTIVDIGSGDAYLATNIAIASPHSTVAAVDIHYDETVVNDLNSRKPSNIHYFNNLPSAQSCVAGPCNMVILMDVLEHVADPGALLQQIRQTLSLTPETQFIITVPAFQFLFSEHDRKLGHYKRYSRKELNAFLRLHGFTVEKSGYCFSTLLLPRLLQVAAEKLGRRKATVQSGIHNWKGNKFFTAVIKNLFWAEFQLSWFLARMNIHLPGLTCYSICHHSPSLFHAITKKKG